MSGICVATPRNVRQAIIKDIVKVINPIVAVSSKYRVRRPTRPFLSSRTVESFASQKSPELAALLAGAALAVSLP
jgi:hypothetical protein